MHFLNLTKMKFWRKKTPQTTYLEVKAFVFLCNPTIKYNKYCLVFLARWICYTYIYIELWSSLVGQCLKHDISDQSVLKNVLVWGIKLNCTLGNNLYIRKNRKYRANTIWTFYRNVIQLQILDVVTFLRNRLCFVMNHS